MSKIVHLQQVEPVPVRHDRHLLKRVLLQDSDTRSNLKMLNHACLEVGESFSAHRHPDMEEVFYFLEGEGQFSLNGERVSVQSGDCLYVSCGTTHTCTNTGNQPLVFLAFGVAL